MCVRERGREIARSLLHEQSYLAEQRICLELVLALFTGRTRERNRAVNQELSKPGQLKP